MPRKIRELQLISSITSLFFNYTIPRKIRELQSVGRLKASYCIIPYQEKLGNYNCCFCASNICNIIPYQEKLGNYNFELASLALLVIIPYQEKLGNYNQKSIFHVFWVYHIFLFFAKKPAPTVFRQGCFSVLRFDFKQVAELNSASPPYEIPYISIQSLTCKK